MRIDDARAVNPSWYSKAVVPLLNDPRDAVFVGLMVQCACVAVLGLALFAFGGAHTWQLAPFYWLVVALGLLDRFTLMLHCTSHRPLFAPRYRWANSIIPWVLGPFFGQTPGTYFAHHMGMHHQEENLEDDLSSTMSFERDRFSHWLRYYGRFMFLGLIDLSRYFAARKRDRLRKSVVVGEGSFLALAVVLFALNPAGAFVVFVFPVLLIRTLMMIGNWGQHAFVEQGRPEDPYVASITCINSRYNRRCFNDGYHIGHHLAARAHWTEYPVQFEAGLEEYARKDAIVFEGIDFFMVWLFLMTGSWSRLARAFVQLPGAKVRDEAEIIRFLKARVRPFPACETNPVVAA